MVSTAFFDKAAETYFETYLMGMKPTAQIVQALLVLSQIGTVTKWRLRACQYEVALLLLSSSQLLVLPGHG